MTKPKYPTLYRVTDSMSPGGLVVHFLEYAIIGETDKCWYVLPEGESYLVKTNPAYAKRCRKRVLKEQIGRRLCYVCKRMALNSYRERKRWQIKHAKTANARGEAGMLAADKLLLLEDIPTEDHVEPSDHIQNGFDWSEY